MKKISVTDEWLYKYMPVVDEAIIRELESNIDYEYQFTDKFERRMKKLMRREAYPWIGIFYRLYKKAAILFVCMISSLFVITMSVQAYRVKFYETVKSVWEDSIFYSYLSAKLINLPPVSKFTTRLVVNLISHSLIFTTESIFYHFFSGKIWTPLVTLR